MTVRTAREDDRSGRPLCWCCGAVEDPDRLVRLGNHPEVGVCTRCAHAISKWAWEIEDRSRTGVAVRTRDRLRRVRGTVVRRGWHRNRFIGGPLRWIGRFTP
ncbi:MAG TPA: hypothetical protein VFX70_16460 [Mycobacteriales bacterium]|nr:hypothetical protein [Mycobacteriales bacterium]